MDLPEEKIAARWLARLNIRPIVDISSVIHGFAHVVEDHIPFDADAILIGSKGSGKPTIVLRRELVPTRRTFTLAHELGHILIPWHAGSFVCKPDPAVVSDAVSQYLHGELEKEANRFAAEFLLPAPHVRDLFNKYDDPILMLGETGRAKISKLAASFKFLRCLPPNFVMVEVDSYGVVSRSFRTSQTIMAAPKAGTDWDATPFASVGAKIGSVPLSSGEIVWLDLRSVRVERPRSGSVLRATQILEEILAELGKENEQARLLASINGVIGAANNTMRRGGSGDLYTILWLRFREREKLQSVVRHPRFKEFLAARVREIESRTG